MADVDIATGLNSGLGPASSMTMKFPYAVSVNVSWAAAATAKGSALAAADVIQAIDVPLGTAVLNAFLLKVDAPTGTVSVCTLDVGTGVDVDVFVDGFDYYAAVAGDWAQAPAAYQPVVAVANDTVDVLIASLTGTLLTGNLTLTAVLLDATRAPLQPGLAALGS